MSLKLIAGHANERLIAKQYSIAMVVALAAGLKLFLMMTQANQTKIQSDRNKQIARH